MPNIHIENHSAILCFLMVARHHHLDFTIESILHKYALQDTEVPIPLLLRIAKEQGFRAKETTLNWDKLFRLGKAFPAIAKLKSGKYVILSGVQNGENPQVAFLNPLDLKSGFKLLTKEELAEVWDGTTIFIKRTYKLSDENQPFSLRWFLPEILREKGLFRDVATSSMRNKVFEEGADTKLSVLDAESRYSAIQADVEGIANELKVRQQRIAQIESAREAFISNWRNETANTLTTTKKEHDTLVEQFAKAARYRELAEMASPVDAVVLDIGQYSVGSVVKEGMPIMTLVPLNTPLEAEVSIETKDIGYVHVGDEVRLKLDAFPFQRHAVSFFLKTKVYEKTGPPSRATRKTKVLFFSKIILEMLFSIFYYHNEF